MFEKIKKHKNEIIIVASLTSIVVITALVTRTVTANYYTTAIRKMNQTAHDAGVLETLLDYQNTH